MLNRTWSDVIAENSPYNEGLLQRACLALITQQSLFRSDHGSKVYYDALLAHRRPVESVMALVGLDIHFSAQYDFISVTPREATNRAHGKSLSLLMLVLRQMHFEGMNKLHPVDGHVEISLVDLRLTYKALTGIELESRGPLEEMLRPLYDARVVRQVTRPDDGQPFGLLIRPTIEKVVLDGYLAQLDAHMQVESLRARKARGEAIYADAEEATDEAT